MTRPPRYATALIVLVSLVACTDSAPQSTPTPGPDRARDRGTARAIVLTKLDFPKGWTSRPHRETKADAKAERRFEACAHQSGAETVTVNGRDLARGPLSAFSSVTFVRTAEDAAADLAGLRGAKVRECIEDLLRSDFEREAPRGASLRSLAVRSLKLPRLGEGTVGFRIVASLAVGATVVDVFIDLALITADRAEISVGFTSVGGPFPAALERRVLRRVKGRLGLL